MTRCQTQQQINELYAQGKISREEWSQRFDELSSSQWNAAGPVKLKKERKKENEPVHDDR
jgi:hypothetical protein